jgi:transcriptional regulator with XRE-family HTH domain
MNLAAIRKASNMSAKQVYEAVGITQQHYNYVENGKRQPSVPVAKKIGAVLGFDWTKFYEDGA